MLLALPGTAIAQDADKWTGAYFGGFASSLSYEESGTFDDGTKFEFDSTITTLNGFVGYDKQITPQFVVGGEVGLNVYATEDELLVENLKYSLDSGIWFRGRAGFVADSMLIYGLLGQGTYKPKGSYDNVSFEGDSDTGVEFGAGLELMLRENISARFEYARVKFDFDEGEGSLTKIGAGVAYRF